jgi:hypothetical protein
MEEIIKLCMLKGKNVSGKVKDLIQRFIIFIENNKALIKVVDMEASLILYIKFNVECEGDATIPILISDFIKVLSRFKDSDMIEISYDVTENTISLNRDKPKKLGFQYRTIPISKVNSTLTREFPIIFNNEIPEFIIKDNKLKYQVRIELEQNELNDVIKDSDVISSKYYPMSYDGRTIIFNVANLKGGSKSFRELEIDNIKNFEEVKQIDKKFGSKLSNVINSFSGKVRLYLGNECPLLLYLERKEYDAYIVIAEAIIEGNESEI